MTYSDIMFDAPNLGFRFDIVVAQQIVEWAITNEPPHPPAVLKKLGMIHCVKQRGYTRFVETGTYLGDTANVMAANGCRVFTIELSQRLYEQAVDLFANTDQVTCFQGDSSVVLAEVIGLLDGPALFWLDGHYSGPNTAMGGEISPVLGELECLRRARETRPELIDGSTIYIDDLHCFGDQGYPTLEALHAAVRASLPRHTARTVNNTLRVVPGP